MDTDTFTVAEPRPHSVKDAWGDFCPRATTDDYPLTADCVHCRSAIRLVTGDADWAHKWDGQTRCGR